MYNQFNLNEIKPTGWLLEQLKLQASGQAGNLDKIWPDVRDSEWIGGEAEGWERVPYWLDGFIPLAYLLDDEDMKKRTDKYIYGILERQQEDGWICPSDNKPKEQYDVWAFFLIGKVLALYCEFTNSECAEKGLYKAMKCLYDHLQSGKIKLFRWGEYRWFECFIPLSYLYQKYNESWMIELANILKSQGADYRDYKEHWKKPLNKWTLYTHVVNVAMMLKYEAVSCELLGGEYCDYAEELWTILEEYNGTAVATFTGDECLSGKLNNQGTELCSVVELMYTCEVLYSLTGNNVWADRLEKIAFNALPATISDDMWTHQYDQQVNQIACVKFPGKSHFRTNDSEAHLFGLEPHFGCCTANHGQGWPKLVLNSYLKTDKGILAAFMLPTSLSTEMKGAKVQIDAATEYPFRLGCEYTISTNKAVEFEFMIRIPSWVKSVKINGEMVENQEYICVDKTWEGTESLNVEFYDEPHFVSRPNDLYVVEHGPLVFALPIQTKLEMHEYEKDGVERRFPYCDYELYPESEWRYGFSDEVFEVCELEGDSYPFSSVNPRIALKTRMSRVEWEYADGYDSVSAVCPISNVAVSDFEEKLLIPYGCAKLRLTEMPKVEKR